MLPAMKRNYTTLKLSDAQSMTPAPAGVGAWAEQLREAAYDAVKEGDVKELMATYMEKAKAGDLNAAKFVLNFLTGGAPKVQVQKVMVIKKSRSTNRQAPSVKPNEPTDEELDEVCRLKPAEPASIATPAVRVLRKMAAMFLRAEGDSPAAAIAQQLEVSLEDLEAVMQCDWFQLKRGSWDLTPAGRAAI